MAELKPCPFCGCFLKKRHIHYMSIKKTAVDYDVWEHPINDCVLSNEVPEGFGICEQDIESWNRRAEDGKT